MPLTASSWTAQDLREFVVALEHEQEVYEHIATQHLPGADRAMLEARREGLLRKLYPVRKRLQPMKRDWPLVRGGMPQSVVARVETRICRVRSLQTELGIN